MPSPTTPIIIYVYLELNLLKSIIQIPLNIIKSLKWIICSISLLFHSNRRNRFKAPRKKAKNHLPTDCFKERWRNRSGINQHRTN